MHKLKNILKKKLGYYILILFMFFNIFYALNIMVKDPVRIEYNEFNVMLDDGVIQEVSIDLKAPEFKFTDNQGEIYITDNPRLDTFKSTLLSKGVKVVEKSNNNLFGSIIQAMIPSFLYLGLLFFLFRGTLKGISTVSKPKTKISSNPSVKFSDVAGNEESKDDMAFLIEFLKQPQKYLSMGATLPKGIIFYGPPGTGKTLMAKAIAGEAGVPFYYISGSDFVEMYVGVGAKRVRELFAEAKKTVPCVVFIDEIDAIGGKRGGGYSNSERDQTINALLNELDGFDTEQGILVIAATNRLEELDDALLRPGRFDRHIAINLPDKEDRLKILKLHAKGKTFMEDVDFEELAKTTINFSGAGLKTLLNESAIIAVNNNHKHITKDDIDKAFYKLIMKGDEKKNRKDREQFEVELVAWHEAGHALVTKLITNRSVPKVSIVPSTSGAGGVTFITPNKMGLHSKKDLEQDVMISYGGRIAEYLLLDDENKVTTGASSDIKQATSTIMSMIKHYGMSDKFGLLSLSEFKSQDDTLVLEEAKVISSNLYNETLSLLRENLNSLKAVADQLIKKETLDENELDKLIDLK